jgi:hypothetical protein
VNADLDQDPALKMNVDQCGPGSWLYGKKMFVKVKNNATRWIFTLFMPNYLSFGSGFFFIFTSF